MAWKSFRDESRTDWGRVDCGSTDQKITREDIKYGATLRIADALERLAIGKASYEQEQETQRQRARAEMAESSRNAWMKSARAYKGRITRLKKAKKV